MPELMKCPSKRLHFQLLCYRPGSWQRLGVSACVQFKIFVVKVGSTCENRTDLVEKRIFHYILSKKLSEAHRNISILKVPSLTFACSGTICSCVKMCKDSRELKIRKAETKCQMTATHGSSTQEMFCITKGRNFVIMPVVRG